MPGHMQSFHVQVGADKVTSLLIWRSSDHGPYCGLLSVHQVWRRSDNSTWSWRWCCQLAEFYGDYSTREIITFDNFSVPFVYMYIFYQLLVIPPVLWRCWLGGRKGIRPVKNWVVGFWRGYLSGARCKLAYGASWCHCHSLSLASVKSRSVLPFWYRLTRVVPEKGPSNGCK